MKETIKNEIIENGMFIAEVKKIIEYMDVEIIEDEGSAAVFVGIDLQGEDEEKLLIKWYFKPCFQSMNYDIEKTFYVYDIEAGIQRTLKELIKASEKATKKIKQIEKLNNLI